MKVVYFADDIRIRILQMQVLLSPHIAEESEMKMDEYEAQLAEAERAIQADFIALHALPLDDSNTQLAKARSAFDEFQTVKSQILKLSRENTGIRAAKLALNEKRKAMLACQAALTSLERAVLDEPSLIPSGRQ